jgi:hypothetical protein
MLFTLFACGFLPIASANPDHSPFPDISFKVFSNFINDQFGSQISLATVLVILFSMTNNPDLLNLHGRQQIRKVPGEITQSNSGWIKALALALENRLGDTTDTLFRSDEQMSKLSEDQITSSLGSKLHGLSKTLCLYPFDEQSKFVGQLKPISKRDIEPVQIICPISMECETKDCQSRAIRKFTRERDTPSAVLIKGTKLFDNVPVLAGQCPKCLTIYHADHERSSTAENASTKLYLNSAKFLKIGQNIWVDRIFSRTVLNATYHFHASTTAFAAFWNASFWSTQRTGSRKLSRRQVWQAFIQESVRKVASVSGFELELPDRLAINEVTKEAFKILGEDGVIRSADKHSCSECTHEYKSEADKISETDNPAGLIGVDENHRVPDFQGEDRDDPIAAAANKGITSSRVSEDESMDVDSPSDDSMSSDSNNDDDDEEEMEPSTVHMVIMDGIVMGPKHCAYADCTGDLVNYTTGVFCAVHENMVGNLCRVKNCRNPKADGIHTCIQHRNLWRAHVLRFGRASLLGIRRLLRRSEEERQPWLPTRTPNVQPHDEPAPASTSSAAQKNYFVAPRFYCVETICAPCGVVIAWTKFSRAESPSNILDFLDKVYPNPDSRPDYVCIDKACQLLRHAVASGRWNVWQNTTRFIVDSYHYINHRTSDYLCRKYCNPAPLNGSAPNLVVVELDKAGKQHFKRAFNTQVNIYSMLILLLLIGCNRLVNN